MTVVVGRDVPADSPADATAVDDGPPPKRPRRRRRGAERRGKVLACQVALLVGVLVAWEYLPKIEWLSERYTFFDPFFISSPSSIRTQVLDMAFGRSNTLLIWPYLWRSLEAALIGMAVGVGLGAAVGLVLSSSDFAARVFKPFIAAVNATPRVAFIPLVVILFGATRAASVTVAILVVFFVAFFNAFEGGRTVPSHLIQNCRLLGASTFQTMIHVRLPYVVAWCMAAVPVALAFSLVSVVTAEVFTGYQGVGRLLLTATATVNSALTFSLVVYLAVMGVLLVSAAEAVKRRVLHWWTES